MVKVKIYAFEFKNWIWATRKLPRLNDLKRLNINNIEPLTIVQARGFGAAEIQFLNSNAYIHILIQKKKETMKEEWGKHLSPEQWHVLRNKGTEPPFSGDYWDFKGRGSYLCAACRLPLFSSEAKFDSGTGWPSFWEPIHVENIDFNEDRRLLPVRTEVCCHRCRAHLGHVFEDGPPPTGMRYCINSLALKFQPNGHS